MLCIKILFALQSPVFKAYRIFAKEKGTFFSSFFENAAECFIRVYDYYQPHAPISMSIFTSVSHRYSCKSIFFGMTSFMKGWISSTPSAIICALSP